MASRFVSWLRSSKYIGAYYGFFLPAAFLLCLALSIGTIFVGKDHRERSIRWGIEVIQGAGYSKITSEVSFSFIIINFPPTPHPQLHPLTQPPPSSQPLMELETQTSPQPSQSQYRVPGSEPLPKGLVANTSDLQMQPLWGRRKKVNSTTSLFTAAVGIKQIEMVDKIVRKFLSSDFSVMLFHYDGVVDGWKELEWADSVVHISAINQTKWWFAKRFLHPDIVTEYSYIFLWDEDLGVDNFDPERYISIIKTEGLEISQPALDTRSEMHHKITARWSNSTFHRLSSLFICVRAKPSGNKHGCDGTNNYPPCTGWVELMAPVFSRAAWRCVWYMIQSDLNHAWGLDILFGYCAQGDRTKNVGVVDAEYIVHYGLPTFGELQNKVSLVRRHSHQEYKIFKRRWQEAAKEDETWVDPYPHSWNYTII
ncbi:hypothetical protein E3N88_00514 [Mikania micrantha]|uniref:Uncharacterized protein n=1 Tax=Mikania micrantha TaxID=192012 RepID=A0A5N6Q0F8_9ASTR|nr:hypothetical protein E3N88_00514 [Mikania micrantha]